MKYFGIVSYNGKNYYGFEKQKEYPSIQGKLEEILSSLLDHKITIHGAGRTDKGVSAKGQTFSFVSNKEISSLETFRKALNRLLPKDIYVSLLKEVDSSFDARHSSCGKMYSYSFHYGERNPLSELEYQMEFPNFSIDRFKECLNLLLGEHDFKNFTSKPHDVDNFIRTIKSIDIEENNGHVRVLFKGNGFMTYQIRIMMGVAFRVALGRMALEDVTKNLNAKERKIISFKADPIGLCLEEVFYE